jgi:hypothetical protein
MICLLLCYKLPVNTMTCVRVCVSVQVAGEIANEMQFNLA